MTKEQKEIQEYWDSVYAELTEEQIYEMERQFTMVEEKCSMNLPHEYGDPFVVGI